MPRPRDFDSADVLNSVTDVFTAHGYAGTSVSMLVEHTGLGKQSLYNSFGDKQNLYLKALDRAVDRMACVQDAMRVAKTGGEAIKIFFEAVFTGCLSNAPEHQNCIVSGGLMEGVEDAEIHEKLYACWNATKDLLARYVKAGQLDGSIRMDMQSDDIAISLMTIMSGLRVTARVVKSKETLQKIIQNGLCTFWMMKEGSENTRSQESRP